MYRLNDRILRLPAHHSDATFAKTKPASTRPHFYRHWDDVSMVKAMTAVENGTSLSRASEMFGVPKSTLSDRVSGKVQHGCQPGAVPYLTQEEEEELLTFLIRCAEIGYPHSIEQVLGLVQQVVDFKGMDKVVTRGWWQRFCQRHDKISLRTAVPLSMVRSMASDIKVIERYFDILEDTLKENHIFNNPGCIYNCDETGIPLSPKGLKVVAERGSKVVSCMSGDSKGQVTVLACTCANGTCLPPMVIFNRKTLNPDLTAGEIPGTIYGLSDKGWINRELFYDWFHKHFLALISPARPVLLLMDGHSSHYSPDVIRAAAEEKVILFTLPPHSTHLTQPLDRSCFSPLKTYWKKVAHNFYTQNPGRVITKFDFSALFADAWKCAMTPKNIISGFKVTGIYPFCRSTLEVQIPQATKSLTERTGLAYIPLYSPASKRIHSEKAATPTSSESFSSDNEDLHLEKSFSESDIHLNYQQQHLREKRATSVTRFLNTPQHPSKQITKHEKSCGKVLTSLENIKILEAKERQKEELKKEKERRKAEREANKAKKNAEKISKAQKKSMLLHIFTWFILMKGMYDSLQFTEDELKKFNKRYENGYDLQHDERYNLWVKLYHPTNSQVTRGRNKTLSSN